MTKPPLATTIGHLLSLLVITPVSLVPSAFAGETGTTTQRSYSTTTVVEREIIRRRASVAQGVEALEAGERALKEKDYEKAYAQFLIAAERIPNAENTRRLHVQAVHGLCDAAVLLAEQRIAEGRYKDAELTLRKALDYDPHCKKALVILTRLEEPDYYNKTITPKFRANVEQVKQWFVEAKGFYDTGRFDLAYKRCEQILNVDRYNIAARKMQEDINRRRDDYAIEGYNNTRAYMNWQVQQAWDRPVRRFGAKIGETIVQVPTDSGLTQRLQRKLETIVIPRLEFREATIREAIEFLKKKSAELDSTTTDPAQRGVNIVLKLDAPVAAIAPEAIPAAPAAPVIPGLEPLPGAGAAPAPDAPVAGVSPGDARITVSLQNIPLGEALRYVTGLANLKYKVEQYAVSVVPQGTPTETLVTKEWKVPPGMFSQAPAAGGGDALAAPAAGAAGGNTDATRGGRMAGRVDAKDYLTASGVTFPPGSSAIFLPSSSKLIVKNTQENLDLIDAIVESVITGGPVQVEIESKFVEITQANSKELSFDWLLGQFNVPGVTNQSVFASGGTAGNTSGIAATDTPILFGGQQVGSQPLTSGLRSGSFAIGSNAIDALLAGGSVVGRTPALGAIAGVFTDPQFQVIIRALNQKKGVDLLSAPRVTTKSGQRAVIEIIREFRYPTEFDPPQIPQTFGNQNGNGGGTVIIPAGAGALNPLLGQNNNSFPVTPTTPTSFETRNTGVTLEVEPVVGPDNYTIDLNLVPQVVEFEGFINYGSPIQTTSTNALGQQVVNVITPNIINQPIFSTRKVTTSVSVFDGATVVLGGLMREDVQKVEDKIPLLGDIPLLGRLFRSNVEQHLKRNLVIFVSARLINPAGEAVHAEEEVEEIVETLPAPEIPPLPLELPQMSK
jgi:general secretion pathway protein D